MQKKNALRRLLALALLCAMLAALFVGCAKDTKNADGATASQNSETVPAGTLAPAESETRDPSIDYDGLATLPAYTVAELGADDPRLDAVVATCAGEELTNRQLQVYYYMQIFGLANQLSQYGMSPSDFGLDLNKPLSEQPCPQVTDLNWEQFFLMTALEQFHQMASVKAAADEAQYTLPESDQENLETAKQNITKDAEEQGCEDLDEYMHKSFGTSVAGEDYYDYLGYYFRVVSYEGDLYKKLEYSDEDLLAYFNAHKETDYPNVSTDQTNVNVRHILITPEKAEGASESTDEQWDAAKTKAEELLAEYEKNPTEENFADLATKNSTDPGSASNGGLYEDVYPGQMVETFNDWCFDESRQPGDTGIVKTDYGYHIMYFVSQTENYYWKTAAAEGYTNDRMQTILDELLEKSPIETDYASVVIGPVPENFLQTES